jgi:hypothetical protein
MRTSKMPNWDKFLIEGHTLFTYMIQNFGTMFDGDTKIKHFDIESGVFGICDYIDDIKETYSDDIQIELIQWIQREMEETTLCQSSNWRPFRDQDLFLYMFLGYKKMFRYKHYYFQLILLSCCEQCDTCEYCKQEDNRIHFAVALYGWKDETKDSLQPYNIFTILHDDLMPDSFWRID